MHPICHGRQIGHDDPRREAGFTMVELLVTVVLIGILAAIALPYFTSHRASASDAAARSLVADGALALQAYAATNDGFAATRDDVLEMAPGLAQAPAWDLEATPTRFSLSVTSASAHVFQIERTLTGTAVRTCSDPGAGGCPASGEW